ncbi:hypothetical protein ABZ793_30700 [Micromonospora sp. NPDC047465]|uniref:hypothetical protein n=1 Tax=Micromonospora sp. NPDC047465 TaxID=3154813 RepID=UPI0033E4AD53
MAEGLDHTDYRPVWAARLRAERTARGWSQADAVRAMRAHSREPLPADSTLLRNWKRWEAGGSEPDAFYKTLVAETFGTVTAAFFPPQTNREADGVLLAGAGTETLEILARVRSSDVSPATLDALRITADRLCCEYPYLPSEQLHAEGHAWLRRITSLMDRRLTLAQHREVLTLAGWIALLVGCVEYDMGQRRAAEATRKAALSLGEEAGNAAVSAWAYEMRAWYALTQGDYRGVIAAAEAAIAHGRQALQGDRKSLPSLLMCSRELTSLLAQRYPKQPEVSSYLEEVRTLAA